MSAIGAAQEAELDAMFTKLVGLGTDGRGEVEVLRTGAIAPPVNLPTARLRWEPAFDSHYVPGGQPRLLQRVPHAYDLRVAVYSRDHATATFDLSRLGKVEQRGGVQRADLPSDGIGGAGSIRAVEVKSVARRTTLPGGVEAVTVGLRALGVFEAAPFVTLPSEPGHTSGLGFVRDLANEVCDKVAGPAAHLQHPAYRARTRFTDEVASFTNTGSGKQRLRFECTVESDRADRNAVSAAIVAAAESMVGNASPAGRCVAQRRVSTEARGKGIRVSLDFDFVYTATD